MKEHGDNGTTTAARGLPPSSQFSSDKIMRDQELQHLVTSSIPSPTYGGLSLINASLVFGADPIYSAHLFANLAANNPNARFQLPIPIPLALQPAPASHPANQLHHHQQHQRNMYHHLPAAAVPGFAGLPGATLPHAAQLDLLSSWVHDQQNKSNDDRKITSTTSTTPIPPTTPNKKNGAGKNNRKNSSQVNSKNNKNLNAGNVIKLSKRSANGSANDEVAKKNRKNKGGRHHLNHDGIITSSENDVLVKKEQFEKDAEPMSMSITESIIKPFIVENLPIARKSEVQRMEIDHSPPPSMKVGKGGPSSGSPSPNRIANNNNANLKTPGQISPGAGQNGSRDKVFTCPTCSRTFGYKHVLQNHERTHTGEKPFECTICMKKFTRDHHLKTHMRLHTGEKPYQCTHCDRQFVQVANLRRHLRVHTGERPYACQLCSSRFSDSNQLKAHMLIHKGEKPYSCKECGGQFRRRHHLAHHKCSGEEASVKSLFHQDPSSSSSPDTSPPQLLTPSRAAGSDRGDNSSLVGSGGKRERKCRETRRIIRLDTLPVAATITHNSNPLTFVSGAVVPEQDHPEDLSMSGNTGRSPSYSGSSSSVTGSSSPSPRSALPHGTLLLRSYCNSSSEETPDLFSDEDLRAADSSTNGKNESSSDDISFKSHHE